MNIPKPPKGYGKWIPWVGSPAGNGPSLLSQLDITAVLVGPELEFPRPELKDEWYWHWDGLRDALTNTYEPLAHDIVAYCVRADHLIYQQNLPEFDPADFSQMKALSKIRTAARLQTERAMENNPLFGTWG